MEFGLAKGPIEIEKIIYGRTISERRMSTYFLNNAKPEPSKDFFKNPEPEKGLATSLMLVNMDLNSNVDHEDAKLPENMETVYLDTETTVPKQMLILLKLLLWMTMKKFL